MDDLISRAEVIELIKDSYYNLAESMDDTWAMVADVEKLPSIQPRKGKWIDYSDEGYVECPFCHSATNCDGNKDELHYCFSCGAELR